MMTPRLTKPLRVLVTGGANGIGKTTCRRFIAAGASVAMCDADDSSILQATRGNTSATGISSRYC
jgi:NAD(P)-dependent dehydrogenase (short-subunit alcohol dehydrogenase family)